MNSKISALFENEHSLGYEIIQSPTSDEESDRSQLEQTIQGCIRQMKGYRHKIYKQEGECLSRLLVFFKK